MGFSTEVEPFRFTTPDSSVFSLGWVLVWTSV